MSLTCPENETMIFTILGFLAPIFPSSLSSQGTICPASQDLQSCPQGYLSSGPGHVVACMRAGVARPPSAILDAAAAASAIDLGSVLSE